MSDQPEIQLTEQPTSPPITSSGTPQEAAAQPKKRLTWKLVTIITVIVVLLAAGGVGGYYVLYQTEDNSSSTSTPTPTPSASASATPTPTATATPTPTPTTDPYVGWKTYTDPVYGFSFKYPEETATVTQENVNTNFYVVKIELGTGTQATEISFNQDQPLGCSGPDENDYSKDPVYAIALGNQTKEIKSACWGYWAKAVTPGGIPFLIPMDGYYNKPRAEEAKLILASTQGFTLKTLLEK